MKKKIVFTTLISLFIFCFFNIVHADTTVHLDIETSTGSLYNQDITVTPCNNDNNTTTIVIATPYCAILQLQPGLTSDWSWSSAYGEYYLNSISSTVNNDSNNGIYWDWFLNSNLGSTGLSEYTLVPGDSILLTYDTNPLKISVDNQNPTVGNTIKFTVTQFGYDSSYNPVWNPAVGGKIIINSNTFDLDSTGSYSFTIPDTTTLIVKGQMTGFLDTPQITITPQAIVIPPPVIISSGGGGGWYIPTPIQKPKFDLGKAFEFLSSQQKENGSFGDDLYTDWTALALASGNNQDQTLKLIKYFEESKKTYTLLTDYERHAMALMALGLNPYDTNGENYIQKITDSFDGKQFGNMNEDNDDIFALIVLQNAGFTQADKMINDDINFILSEQKADGSWDESVDITGASIESLSTFSPTLGVGESLSKAEVYLKQNQKSDGGWGNISSTSWAMEGILALNEKSEDWINGSKNPIDYLALNQDTDGGIKNSDAQSKLWETTYAVSALSGKSWNQIMQKFDKPEIPATLNIKAPAQKTELQKKIVPITKIPNQKNLAIQNTATVILPASISTLSAFLRFFKIVFGKIL